MLSTIELVETLLYQFPELRKVFLLLNIMSIERKISASSHPEFKNILKPFLNKMPKVVSVVGLTQITILISQEKIGRTWPIIIIKGDKSEILECSKGKICDILNKHLKWKDYLPEPLIKKIIYISDYNEKVTGVVFSEYRKNMWTIYNPLDIDVKTTQKTTSLVIINEILADILI